MGISWMKIQWQKLSWKVAKQDTILFLEYDTVE
jgi:hypothetical protein